MFRVTSIFCGILWVAFVLLLGSAKAITVDATHSALVDGNQVQVPLGANITVFISTTAADPFDGAAGGDYNINLFNGPNLFQSFVRSPTVGSTTDVFSFQVVVHATSIVFEARSGVTFDLVSAVFSSSDPNSSIAGTPLKDVAAPFTPTATPLPAALPLFATGLGALSLLSWHRKRKAAVLAA